MNSRPNRLLQAIMEHIDLPDCYYEKAAARYKSVGKWFHESGRTGPLDPEVSLQGSFRYGTVIKPLAPGDEYDIDLTCMVNLSKQSTTQAELKRLLGEEVAAYSHANGIHEEPTERNRCWRLDYADQVQFHLDILPSIPEDPGQIQYLVASGVPYEWANEAVAITDRRDANFRRRTSYWPSSNPVGLGRWFESQNVQSVTEAVRLEKSIAEVPSARWKTPLQRVIQLMKRHRDTMFLGDPELRPISMIITILATYAYRRGENLAETLAIVAEGMDNFVQPSWPRIANPVNPSEDFADKWSKNPDLELNFRRWLNQLKVDVGNLQQVVDSTNLEKYVLRMFSVGLTQDQLDSLRPSQKSSRIISPPTIHIPRSAPQPWADQQ